MSDKSKDELEDRLDELEEENNAIKDFLSKYVDKGPSRRQVLKGGATAAGAGMLGFGAGNASAQASESDNDGNVGTDANRVDVFADGVAANSVSTGEVNNTVYPERFGAAGDGTTDDYQALQDAADSASASNPKALELSAGKTYYVSQTVQIDAEEIRQIDGNNAQILIDGGYRAIEYTGSLTGTASPGSGGNSDMADDEFAPSISNLHIYSDQRNPSVGTGLYLNQLHSPTIENVFIFQVDTGIEFGGQMRNLNLVDNNIWDFYSDGVLFDGTSIHQANLAGNHISYGGHCINFDAAAVFNFQLTGNDFELPGSSQASGDRVHIHSTGATHITGLQGTGNCFEHGNSHAFELGNAAESDRANRVAGLTLGDNEFNDLGDTACRIDAETVEDVIISDSRFYEVDGVIVRVDARPTDTYHRIKVVDNVAECGGLSQLSGGGTITNFSQDDNEIEVTSGSYGLFIQDVAALENASISGNNLTVADSHTLGTMIESRLDSAVNLDVVNNKIFLNGDGADGIDFNNWADSSNPGSCMTFRDNKVFDCTGTAFDFPAAETDNIVVGDNLEQAS